MKKKLILGDSVHNSFRNSVGLLMYCTIWTSISKSVNNSLYYSINNSINILVPWDIEL
jgi:hypothetical protein